MLIVVFCTSLPVLVNHSAQHSRQFFRFANPPHALLLLNVAGFNSNVDLGGEFPGGSFGKGEKPCDLWIAVPLEPFRNVRWNGKSRTRDLISKPPILQIGQRPVEVRGQPSRPLPASSLSNDTVVIPSLAARVSSLAS